MKLESLQHLATHLERSSCINVWIYQYTWESGEEEGNWQSIAPALVS